MDERVRSIRSEIMKKQSRNNPWRPIGFYMLFGMLWIFLSDRLLILLVEDKSVYHFIQTIKGSLYVFVTAAVLYFLIKMDNAKIYALNKSLSFRNEELVAYSEELTAVDQELHDKIDELSKITKALKDREEELMELATIDHLTHIQNRVKMGMDLEQFLEQNSAFTAILVGIDNFKKLNNFHGHAYGDSLLVSVAKAFSSALGYDYVYRCSGSEFTILLPSIDDNDIDSAMTKLRIALSEIKSVNGLMFKPSACYGIVKAEQGEKIDDLYKKLNVSLLDARQCGADTAKCYSESFAEKQFYQLRLDDAIDHAMKHDEFKLNFQPIYYIESGKTKGFEVLLRWPDNALGERNIGNVISRAEVTGQIVELDKWVVRRTLAEIKKHYKILEGKMISINLSSQSFHSKQFYEHFLYQIKKAGVPPSMIELEVTEHSILEDFSVCKHIMEHYRQEGFNLALDDFGTKFSSLNYLSKLPFDTLKIDKSYIDDITTNSKDVSIVKHIIDLCQDLGLDVIAEGIEYSDQETLLRSFGCTCGQGYLKSKPLDIETALKL